MNKYLRSIRNTPVIVYRLWSLNALIVLRFMLAIWVKKRSRICNCTQNAKPRTKKNLSMNKCGKNSWVSLVNGNNLAVDQRRGGASPQQYASQWCQDDVNCASSMSAEHGPHGERNKDCARAPDMGRPPKPRCCGDAGVMHHRRRRGVNII